MSQDRDITFRCSYCYRTWAGEPARIEDAPDQPWHPFRYFDTCATCQAEVPQVAWERNLFRAWANATGPKTPEGKAASAANLDGHPTPEEARRTRFNAMKHGLRAETATFYPAKPGKYPHCDGCQYYLNGCSTESVACMLRTELFMRHHIAFETKDPAMLTGLHASLQANVRAIIDDMILAIIRTGVELRSPEFGISKDGEVVLVKVVNPDTMQLEQVWKFTAHPLLKLLFDSLGKNSLSLSDLGMTPRVQEDQDIIRGHLDDEKHSSTEALEYQKRQTEALEGLSVLIARSRERVARDPVLIEHQAEDTDDA